MRLRFFRLGRRARIVGTAAIRASFPAHLPYPLPQSHGDDRIKELVASGLLSVAMAPQGTLAERLRAGGAGIGGVFIPVGLGTRFATGQEMRVIDGVACLLEMPLRADFALLRASRADTLGNLVYRGPQRGWNPAMAAAARVSIAEVDDIGPPGVIDPELVITPGIFVNRLVRASQPGPRG